MLLMLACGGLLVVGAALAWRWRARTLVLPAWAEHDVGVWKALRALVWLLNTALLGGLLLGLLVVGPAARLAMRLLAATSSDLAQGQVTDAGEVIGEISLEGTVGLLIFVGLAVGVAFALVYAFAAFALPRGVVGGVVLALAGLVVFGATVDPLRPDNRDFMLLDPGWLSVATFTLMAVLTGAAAPPLLGRLGAALDRPRVWWALWLLPLGFFFGALVTFSFVWLTVVGLVACLVFVVVLASGAGRTDVRRYGRWVVLAALVVAVAGSAPGFFSAVERIAT